MGIWERPFPDFDLIRRITKLSEHVWFWLSIPSAQIYWFVLSLKYRSKSTIMSVFIRAGATNTFMVLVYTCSVLVDQLVAQSSVHSSNTMTSAGALDISGQFTTITTFRCNYVPCRITLVESNIDGGYGAISVFKSQCSYSWHYLPYWLPWPEWFLDCTASFH